ncbi:MAG: S8 family serine peptidase, partial [Planctomycetes bacterium]|nr:S8 family serine peptidase [Planctomycetota bacterium]
MKNHFQICASALLLMTCAVARVHAESAAIRWRSGVVARVSQSPQDAARTLVELSRARQAARCHVVVQFGRPLKPSDKRALARNGLQLLRCLGGNSFFAVVDSQSLNPTRLSAMGLLNGAFEIEQEWKLHPLLMQKEKPEWIRGRVAAGDVAPRAARNRIVLNVMFHPDVSLGGEATNVVTAADGIVLSRVESINVLVVDLPEANFDRLAARDAVQWIEPPLPPLEGVNDQNRVVTQAEAAQSPPYGLDGSGVSVLVFDSGTGDAAHADFGGRLVPRDLSLTAIHSTHVAGTIGGDGSESAGQFRGMAPGVVMESFGFEPNFDGIFLYTNPGDIERDYRDALALGVDLANNSLGTNTCANGFPCEIAGDYGVTANLLDAIVAGYLGERLTTIFAAGNERSDRGECAGGHCCRCIDEGVHTPEGYRSIAPPAAAKNTIGVGALNSNDDTATSFSSWGPTDDGRLKPDISAPGCQTDGDGGVTSTLAGGGYATFCGTSMSTPTTTGIIALILEDYRAQFPERAEPLPSTLKVLLAHNAADVGPVGPDYQTGYGSIRAVDTIDFLRTGSTAEFPIEQAGTSGFLVTVSNELQLKVTVAWDDPPATPNVVNALINDLDLVVIDPNGVQHYPWTLNPAIPTALAVRNAPDAINNVEQVVVDAPIAGVWRVQIVGSNVPEGPQWFSLAATPQLQRDCDGDGTEDSVQIAGDPSLDCSANGVLDVCEPDCNTNGIADSCDIESGDVIDCNGNVIPDQCELASGEAFDCNNNDRLDDCDVTEGAPDCNANFVPDECEADCDSNGQPDDCDIAVGSSMDCNGNTRPDSCDLAAGSSPDVNANSIPDECEGPVIFVDVDAQGTNVGTNWQDAFTSLQSALTVATNSGMVDEIWVAEGVYYPTLGEDRSEHFRMLDGVGIFGGFLGNETNRVQRDITTYETILSGDIGVLGDETDNTFHIVIASNVNSTGILDGFTLADGRASGAAQDEDDIGAAIVNVGGSPQIRGILFRNNFSTGEFPDGGGGAVFNTEGADAIFVDCRFVNNESRQGGAVYVRASSPRFLNCRFEDGTAQAGGGVHSTQ